MRLQKSIMLLKELFDEVLLRLSRLDSEDLVQEPYIFLVVYTPARFIYNFLVILWQPVLFTLEMVARICMFLVVEGNDSLIADEAHQG